MCTDRGCGNCSYCIEGIREDSTFFDDYPVESVEEQACAEHQVRNYGSCEGCPLVAHYSVCPFSKKYMDEQARIASEQYKEWEQEFKPVPYTIIDTFLPDYYLIYGSSAEYVEDDYDYYDWQIPF